MEVCARQESATRKGGWQRERASDCEGAGRSSISSGCDDEGGPCSVRNSRFSDHLRNVADRGSGARCRQRGLVVALAVAATLGVCDALHVPGGGRRMHLVSGDRGVRAEGVEGKGVRDLRGIASEHIWGLQGMGPEKTVHGVVNVDGGLRGGSTESSQPRPPPPPIHSMDSWMGKSWMGRRWGERNKSKRRKSFPVRQRLWASFSDVFTALAALEQAPGSLMRSKQEVSNRDNALFIRQLWNGFLPVMAYASTSIYMVISQAYVLRHKNVKKGIKYSTLLLLYQNMCGIALYFPAKFAGWQTFPFFDYKDSMTMLPNSALFAIMVYSSTQAIRCLEVPMISVLKNFAPITITLVEWILMKGPPPSPKVIFSMVLLIIGAVVAAVSDLTFTTEGYLWMFANVASNVLHLLVLRKLKLNKDLSNTQILHYSALWSLMWLIPVGYLEGIFATMRDFATQPLLFKMVVFSTGVNSILMFLATIWCLERTSGSTYSMVGALNKIPIAIAGYMFFSAPGNIHSIVGICIGLLGGIVFTLAKLEEMRRGYKHLRPQQPPPAPPAPHSSSPSVDSKQPA